ncbi:LLM class flavin-dependent oxidoreductase [Mesorhizobium sp. BAC0120]|uniref:LLM class flavin-dependent oxidoreductase n=1 Tax=Mesorhizobium sp. BAC0120 TaxID=3090670 RepID=UPI00298C372C|nr:LLM class flavin-dependent oxidoreductase [Mesorhizobium sp. BAC0120]MDW6020619.1 LLM class flavin-dependent oxidoreductase [Mesorhizobium sp. BAC0120]
MSGIHLHWYLPTNGDSREIVGSGDDSHLAGGPSRSAFREANLDYLELIAKTAETLGFEAVLTPTGTWCEDAWITTAALSQVTKRLKFLVAFRPGLISPTLVAHQAATFQRISGGRLLLNVVTGGDPLEQRRFGDHLGHDQRYERTGEFLEILRGVVSPTKSEKRFDFEGKHYHIEGAQIDIGKWPLPQIFFGGASSAAQEVAARHVDTYLVWGESPAAEAGRVAHVRELAAAHGRNLSFGIRLHVISRDSEAEAWREAERLLEKLTPERIANAQAILARTESHGQHRMNALHGGGEIAALTAPRVRDLEVSPHLWAGYGLVRGGAGTAIVGSHEQVAALIEEYHAIGFDHFILSGQPHVEEAYHFGEGAFAILRSRGLLAT